MSRYIIISIGVCRTVWMCVSLCRCPRVYASVYSCIARLRVSIVFRSVRIPPFLTGTRIHVCLSVCLCMCACLPVFLNYMIYSFYTRRTQERKRMSFAMRFREDGRFLVETGISRFRFVILTFLRVHIDDLPLVFTLAAAIFERNFSKGRFP